MTNNDDDRDGRSPLAQGYIVASTATAIGFQMAIPPAIGFWADGFLGTSPWLLVVGAILGFISLILQALKLVKDSDGPGK